MLAGKLASILITAVAVALAFGAASSPALAAKVDVHAFSERLTADGQDEDTDGDGISDMLEIRQHGTNPTHSDSDRDGLDDGEEVNLHGTHPLNADSDGDGLKDDDEARLGSDPALADTDTDGLNDGGELALGTGLFATDSDKDGLTDGDEIRHHGSSPVHADSDGDGLADNDEVTIYGTNPAWADAKRVFIYAPGEEIMLPGKPAAIEVQPVHTTSTTRPTIARVPVTTGHSMPALMALD